MAVIVDVPQYRRCRDKTTLKVRLLPVGAGMAELDTQSNSSNQKRGDEEHMREVAVIMGEAMDGYLLVILGSCKYGRLAHHADTHTTSHKQYSIDTDTLRSR